MPLIMRKVEAYTTEVAGGDAAERVGGVAVVADDRAHAVVAARCFLFLAVFFFIFWINFV